MFVAEVIFRCSMLTFLFLGEGLGCLPRIDDRNGNVGMVGNADLEKVESKESKSMPNGNGREREKQEKPRKTRRFSMTQPRFKNVPSSASAKLSHPVKIRKSFARLRCLRKMIGLIVRQVFNAMLIWGIVDFHAVRIRAALESESGSSALQLLTA